MAMLPIEASVCGCSSPRVRRLAASRSDRAVQPRRSGLARRGGWPCCRSREGPRNARLPGSGGIPRAAPERAVPPRRAALPEEEHGHVADRSQRLRMLAQVGGVLERLRKKFRLGVATLYAGDRPCCQSQKACPDARHPGSAVSLGAPPERAVPPRRSGLARGRVWPGCRRAARSGARHPGSGGLPRALRKAVPPPRTGPSHRTHPYRRSELDVDLGLILKSSIATIMDEIVRLIIAAAVSVPLTPANPCSKALLVPLGPPRQTDARQARGPGREGLDRSMPSCSPSMPRSMSAWNADTISSSSALTSPSPLGCRLFEGLSVSSRARAPDRQPSAHHRCCDQDRREGTPTVIGTRRRFDFRSRYPSIPALLSGSPSRYRCRSRERSVGVAYRSLQLPPSAGSSRVRSQGSSGAGRGDARALRDSRGRLIVEAREPRARLGIVLADLRRISSRPASRSSAGSKGSWPVRSS